jgi:type IV pilus assembly protein PilM
MAFGVDVGSHFIKAIQVERTEEGGCKVVAATSRPRTSIGPITEAEASELAEGLRAAGFTGRTCVLVAPSADTLVGTLELPPRSSNAPLDQLARMEMARNFRCPPDSFELAWWELPAGARPARGLSAMGVAIPHSKADPLLDTFEAARFDIAAMDVDPSALVRACSKMLATNGLTAIFDLGWAPASLTLIHRGVVTFSRKLTEVSLGALQDELCRRLSIESDVTEFLLAEIGVRTGSTAVNTQHGEAVELPDEGRRLVATFAETIVRELSLSFDYAAHLYPDSPVSKLLLVGGGAKLGGLQERLAAALSVDVELASPATLAECDPGLLSICASPAMTLALGLAMREAA